MAERSNHQYPHVTVAITHDEDWMEVTKDLPPDEWPDDFKLASMVLDLSEKRLARSLMLTGQQPLAGLGSSEISRPTSKHTRTTNFPACTFCRGRCMCFACVILALVNISYRKIQCDAKQPTCSACLKSNVRCASHSSFEFSYVVISTSSSAPFNHNRMRSPMM